MNYYIGWDVGAWHCKATGTKSKDALAILDEDHCLCGKWEGNLSQTILNAPSQNDPVHFFLEEVFSHCKAKASTYAKTETNIWLAIDTPLGWPTHFRKLICPQKTDETSVNGTDAVVNLKKNKILNPFLHRKTEVALGQSLSAVQDQIGSQSTKALYLLKALGANRATTGVWQAQSFDLTIVETYPAPCMRSLGFTERMKSISSEARITSGDEFDALVCAFLASDFASDFDNLVSHPSEDCDEDEGWIFTPNEVLPPNNGISYERLLGSQSPPKTLTEVLSQIQIGLILKSAIRQSKTNVFEPLVEEWLKTERQPDAIFQETTAAGLWALFKLLQPKAKPTQVPTETLLKETAKRIAMPVGAKQGQSS